MAAIRFRLSAICWTMPELRPSCWLSSSRIRSAFFCWLLRMFPCRRATCPSSCRSEASSAVTCSRTDSRAASCSRKRRSAPRPSGTGPPGPCAPAPARTKGGIVFLSLLRPPPACPDFPARRQSPGPGLRLVFQIVPGLLTGAAGGPAEAQLGDLVPNAQGLSSVVRSFPLRLLLR